MKTPVKAAAAGMSLALVLSACGGSGADEDGTTITFVAAQYSDATEPYWESVIEDFEAENEGLTVELQVISWDDIDGHVTTLVQNGDEPDVLNHNKFSDFAADDLLYEADEVLDSEVIDEFDEGFKDNSMLDDVQYGLPYDTSTRLLFYNTDLFDEAGIDEAPQNWDDLRTAAEQISDLDGDTYGYGLPLGPEEAQAELQIWMNGNGGHYVDDSGEWTIDSQANVEAVTFLSDMVSDDLTQPNPARTDRADAWNAFVQGNVGMVMGHVVLPAKIDSDNPDLNYEIAPIPANGDNESVTLGVQDYLMGFKKDDEVNKDTVSTFLNFVYEEERYAEFLEGESLMAATESANEMLAENEDIKPFIDAMPDAEFYPSNDPNWPAVDGAVKREIGKAVQGSDPQTVLEQIQKRAEN